MANFIYQVVQRICGETERSGDSRLYDDAKACANAAYLKIKNASNYTEAQIFKDGEFVGRVTNTNDEMY
jgi:hypothetical protein